MTEGKLCPKHVNAAQNVFSKEICGATIAPGLRNEVQTRNLGVQMASGIAILGSIWGMSVETYVIHSGAEWAVSRKIAYQSHFL